MHQWWYMFVCTTSSVPVCEIQHENAKWWRAVIDVWCPTVILSPWALCKSLNYTLLKARGQCPLRFSWLLYLWIWPNMNIIIIFRGIGRIQLIWPWALKHAVYWLCHHRCGASKTSSQYSSSSLETTPHRDSSVWLSIISSDIWFGFSRQAFFLMVSKACSFCMAMQCILSM